MLASLALFTVFQGGCKEDTANPVLEVLETVSDHGPIRIAVAGPFTGPLANYGESVFRAAQLAADHVNAQNGVNGRQVKLVKIDDSCKAEMASAAAARVLTEGVDAVLGHVCSSATREALSVYKDSPLVVMSPTSTAADLTRREPFPHFFRSIFYDDAQVNRGLGYLVYVQGIRKIAVLHDQSDYGKMASGFARDFFQDHSQAQEVLLEGITPGEEDYSGAAARISESGARGVYFIGDAPEAARLVKALRKENPDIFFVSDSRANSPAFLLEAGQSAEGVVATGLPDRTKNPMTEDLARRHREKYHTDPGIFFWNAYAGMAALLNAMEKAGTTEARAVDQALRNEWVATPVGILKFDAFGDMEGPKYPYYQVINGKFRETH